MPHFEPKIQCSNPHCSASNDLEARICHRNQCRTPVIKRYLWTITEAISPHQINQLIGDRYFACSTRVFIDTKPVNLPQTPDEIPEEIVAYLQLFPYYPHIPQVYGQIDGTEVWLLEYGTVPLDKFGKLKYPNLTPELQTQWQNASALKQLSWLRQLAKLWKPLAEKNVASSLLNLSLIRINGSIVQLLQLDTDTESKPTLSQLGKIWSLLIDQANPSIQDVLEQLCDRLIGQKIVKSEQIMTVLDRALDLCRHSYDYSYEIIARTNSGPSRNNNEDAAHPCQELPQVIAGGQKPLAIVCDGVGGHEGGEIAAQETINYLRAQIKDLSFDSPKNQPVKILKKLAKFINQSNDLISERNDSEQRQERQRMGTTLVMALANNHELYLGHVGDSRIYWITPESCHQITIDDDLASREVRLGYAVYRDSLQYPSSGALIQALGMRDSSALHPNLQRHIVDDDSIFLLCTDGLSDFDRVEQYWKGIIAPVLQAKSDLTNAVSKCIDMANRKNGHDNVTVALIHCKVRAKSGAKPVHLTWSHVESAIEDSILWADIDSAAAPLPKVEPSETKIPTTVAPTQLHTQPRLLKPIIIVVILAILLGIGAYFYLERQIQPSKDSEQDNPTLIEPDVSEE